MAIGNRTGYVHNMIDKSQTFKQFALSCARAFDALISMRDDSTDTKIVYPLVKESNYYDEKLVEAQKKLDQWRTKSRKEQEKQIIEEARTKLKQLKKYLLDLNREDAKITKMREQVKKWVVPQELENLKNFMLKQLETSLSCCGSYYQNSIVHLEKFISGKENIDEEIRKYEIDLLRNVIYYANEQAQEVDRFNSRNKWLRTLFNAIGIKEGDKDVIFRKSEEQNNQGCQKT